jgi:3-oxoacyl-[acyl-carrier protein] reductase
MNSLAGKVALVTGAGRGIGRAIALALAQDGAAVGCAARSSGELMETVRAIESAGGHAIALISDVTRPDDVEQMVATTVEAFGGLDILVANAGNGGKHQPVESGDLQAWERTLSVNLTGPYLCARAVIPAMKARGGGKIITIGSGMGHRAMPGKSAYACSKAGLWMLTRVLATELKPFGICVNELIPGPVRTEMTADPLTAKQLDTPELDGEWFKEPDDMVPLLRFLAMQPVRGPTGQSFALARREL